MFAGDAANSLGQHADALTFFSKALQLDPTLIDVLASRGHTHYYLGEFEEAASDLKAYLANSKDAKKPPGDQLDAVLWLLLAERRSGQSEQAVLAGLIDRMRSLNITCKTENEMPWPQPVLCFFANPEEFTEDDLLLAARNPDEKRRDRKAGEAFFYLGEHYLIHGDIKKAARYLREAILILPRSYIAYVAAQTDLQRLEHMAAAAGANPP